VPYVPTWHKVIGIVAQFGGAGRISWNPSALQINTKHQLSRIAVRSNFPGRFQKPFRDRVESGFGPGNTDDQRLGDG